MSTLATTAIEEKLHALCETIATDAEVQQAREDAEAFLANPDAVALYRQFARAQHDLGHRQHHGEKISPAEVESLQKLEQQIEANPLISSFMDAQSVLQEIANTVNGFVTKTLEKGRVPSADEVFGQMGGCGEGCGCH